jgi:hypothetical protein
VRFQDRREFKEKHEIFPDEAGLLQVKVGTSAGEAVGILIDPSGDHAQSSASAGPVAGNLEIETTRILQWSKPVLLKNEHHFKEQGRVRWENEVAKRHVLYGQKDGNRYERKHKAVGCYSTDDIQIAVDRKLQKESDRKAPRPGMERLAAVGQASVNRSASVQPPKSMLSLADGGSASGIEETPTRVRAASPLGDGDGASSTTPRTMASSADEFGGDANMLAMVQFGETAFGDTTTSAGVDVVMSESNGRNKPINYWTGELSHRAAFSGRNLTKQLGFARTCVTRHMATNSLEVWAWDWTASSRKAKYRIWARGEFHEFVLYALHMFGPTTMGDVYSKPDKTINAYIGHISWCSHVDLCCISG